MSLDENACSELRKTFFSFANVGIDINGLHPLSVKHLYLTILLPRALFGCELWSNLTEHHILSLERTHRQCVKFMQSLPRNTHTSVAFGLLGLTTLENEIDKRKLLFFGHLCNADGEKRAKILFMLRLFCFLQKPSKTTGYFQDNIQSPWKIWTFWISARFRK